MNQPILDRQAPEGDHERFLTPREVARWLRVTPQTLANWRHTRTGPAFVKFGRARNARIRYSPTAIEEWLQARAETP
jgi:hypothetical protein